MNGGMNWENERPEVVLSGHGRGKRIPGSPRRRPRSGSRYWRLARYPVRQWRSVAAIVVLTVASSAFAVLQPWPLKLLVDYALGDEPVPDLLRSMLLSLSLTPTPTTLVACAGAAFLALFVVSTAVGAGITWAYTVTSQRIMYDIAADIFQRLQRESLLSHGHRSLGDSLSRLSVDTRTLSAGLLALVAPFQQVVVMVMIGVITWRLDPVLAAVLLAVAPVMALAARLFGVRMKRRAMRGREAQARLMSFTHQTLGAMSVVQSFGRERRNADTFRLLADEAVDTVRKRAIVSSGFFASSHIAVTAVSALVLYIGALRVGGGAISIGTLLVFIGYVRRVQFGTDMLLNAYSSVKEAAASGERVLDVLEASEVVHDLPHARPFESRPAGEVRIETVTFGYEPERPVLEEVSVHAEPGEVVALVGPTGAGKSTLVSLVPRFFDPWSGRVSIDGVDVRDLTLASLRSHVSLVLQEPFLLPLSVADNIAYGRPEATREEVVAAAVAANANEFIRALPEGYDTVIDERGARLSGGERQRLTIARALLKDAPVLILDEPTSALDAQTEASVLEALERLIAGRTTFIIAHRLSTVRRADRIVVLDGGRVVEVGTHDELLARGGIYERMHSLQNQDRGAFSDVDELAATALESADPELTEQGSAEVHPTGDGADPPVAAGHVRIEHVTVGYKTGQPVLEDVSVEARPGDVVAVVGVEGTAKTALVSLIPRLSDPWSGRVIIDGIDVRDMTAATLGSYVSVIAQEPLLLPLSIAENIAYGHAGATREEIVSVALAANADDFIRALPEGYDTVIDERGVSLSRVARQRLAIARALLKDAPVLVIYEPASAVEAQPEPSVLEALERLIDGRTTFIVARHPSTVRRADRVVVLDGGRVLEVGAHDQLLDAGGLYARAFGTHRASATEGHA